MTALDFARVIWRWRLLARQAVEDFRYHKRYQNLPTPFLSRFVDQERLLWSNRIRADDYYQLGLFDPEMSAARKRRYIGQYQAQYLFSAMNTKEFHKLTDDKLQFGALASEAGLPVPRILAVVTSGAGIDDYPTIGSEDELRSWMVEGKIQDVVLKPVDGIKGWGVLSLGTQAGIRAAWRKLPGEETVDIGGIWAHCERHLGRGGVIIQDRLKPHPILAAFTPDVLHTVRINTYLNAKPRIIDAILRVGSGKTPTDNISQGGIAVPIDLASGRCGKGSILVDGLPQFVDHHPISGARITDVLLPDWDQVCQLAGRAAETFSEQVTIGWDIGLTAEGPVLLEGNWHYGVRANQLANRRGMLDTPWIEVFNNEGAYRALSLGFRQQRM